MPSIDPVVADTVRHVDSIARFQARVDAAERGVVKDFLAASQNGDANALCQWAGMTTDWSKVKPPVIAGQPLPQRVLQLHEVMVQALDYRNGPDMSEAMQLILMAASGFECKDLAQQLVIRMATTWAKFNTEVQS